MKQKSIAIVGSIDLGRKENAYDPPLKNAPEAKQAAEVLGTTLGARGHRIIVYLRGAWIH